MNNIDDAYVGIEWEPQLTLLNYPRLSVYVLMRSLSEDIKIEVKNMDNPFYSHISLFIPPYLFSGTKRIGIDKTVMNLEVRSRPVKLDNLKDEIEKCNMELAHFIEKLSSYVGPVGVFIPSLYYKDCLSNHCNILVLTKHVNVSLCPIYLRNKPVHAGYIMYDEDMNKKYELSNKGKFHYCEFDFFWDKCYRLDYLESQRMHVKVSYLFNDYESLVSAILNRESKYIIRYDNYDQKLIGYCKKDKYIMINGLT